MAGQAWIGRSGQAHSKKSLVDCERHYRPEQVSRGALTALLIYDASSVEGAHGVFVLCRDLILLNSLSQLPIFRHAHRPWSFRRDRTGANGASRRLAFPVRVSNPGQLQLHAAVQLGCVDVRHCFPLIGN